MGIKTFKYDLRLNTYGNINKAFVLYPLPVKKINVGIKRTM